MRKVICHKCSGAGTIEGFNHVCGGTCFQCKGHGNIWIDDANQPELNAEESRRVDWLYAATDEQISKLNWKQITNARQFVSSERIANAFPELADVWAARYEARFQQLQSDKRAEWEASQLNAY